MKCNKCYYYGKKEIDMIKPIKEKYLNIKAPVSYM